MPTRKEIWETNSSSTHTIVLSKRNGLCQDLSSLIQDGVMYLSAMYFGWEVERYGSMHDKLMYIIAGVSEEERCAIIEKISSMFGCKVDIEPRRDYGYGVIDHQSDDLPKKILKTMTLEEFLRRPYVICTGNDNGDPPNIYLDDKIAL